MQQLTPIVKRLLIINVAVFVVANLMGMVSIEFLALHFNRDFFQPYQLVTHMFTHANSTHILFNMMGLYFFGPMVEMALGAKRFFILYFVAGIGAFLLHYAMMVLMATPETMGQFYIPVVGASGCLFGVLAAFGMRFPNHRVMLLFPPIPMKAWIMVTGYAVIEIFAGFSGIGSGIAHFAHVGGAIAGALLVWVWRRMDVDRYRIN